MAADIIPLKPDLDELRPSELAFIRMAQGGIRTPHFSDTARMANSLERRGYVKEVEADEFWTHWKLTNIGCEIAYAGE